MELSAHQQRHRGSLPQRLLEGFYGELFPPGYQEGQRDQPKVALSESGPHCNLARKRSRSIYGDPHHPDRPVN